MQAKLTRSYRCAPEGHTTVQFEANAIVSGKVAEMAIADDAAIEINNTPILETKIIAPPEAKKPRGRPRKDNSE